MTGPRFLCLAARSSTMIRQARPTLLTRPARPGGQCRSRWCCSRQVARPRSVPRAVCASRTPEPQHCVCTPAADAMTSISSSPRHRAVPAHEVAYAAALPRYRGASVPETARHTLLYWSRLVQRRLAPKSVCPIPVVGFRSRGLDVRPSDAPCHISRLLWGFHARGPLPQIRLSHDGFDDSGCCDAAVAGSRAERSRP